jgi:hypothetical protein
VLLSGLGLGLNLVANLATNTVHVPWPWWPAAVWIALVVLGVVTITLRGRDGRPVTGPGPAGMRVIARGDRSVAIGGDNRGTVRTGDGGGAGEAGR